MLFLGLDDFGIGGRSGPKPDAPSFRCHPSPLTGSRPGFSISSRPLECGIRVGAAFLLGLSCLRIDLL